MHILGVDCAWTPNEPSGVALIEYQSGKTAKILNLGRSYDEFCFGEMKWHETARGSHPDFNTLMQFCISNGWNIDIIALDIPLSPSVITSRRICDNDISKAYGAKGAAVHSPNEQRPGQLAVDIFHQLSELDFIWNGDPKKKRAFIEVYPHASIIELLKLDYRLPYKVQKKNKYWPSASTEERYQNIISNLGRLRNGISKYFDNLDTSLPRLNPEMRYTTRFLKGYEDVLDALICAVTGMFYFSGEVTCYGEDDKIWVLENY